jgi:hypothetical protein
VEGAAKEAAPMAAHDASSGLGLGSLTTVTCGSTNNLPQAIFVARS